MQAWVAESRGLDVLKTEIVARALHVSRSGNILFNAIRCDRNNFSASNDDLLRVVSDGARADVSP